MQTGRAPSPSVLLIGLPAPNRTALSSVIERAGYGVLSAATAGAARIVLAAGSGIAAVLCTCNQVAEDGATPLPNWVSDHHPAVGLLCVCNASTHDHSHLPGWCQVLTPPFDAQDIARELVDARLDAFAHDTNA